MTPISNTINAANPAIAPWQILVVTAEQLQDLVITVVQSVKPVDEAFETLRAYWNCLHEQRDLWSDKRFKK